MLTTAGGLVLGLLANTRNIATLAMNGGLDSVLTLPVHPLPNLLVRRVEPTNLGDVIFGVCLFVFAGHPTLSRSITYILCVLGSTMVLASFLILVSSLSFYAGRTDGAERPRTLLAPSQRVRRAVYRTATRLRDRGAGGYSAREGWADIGARDPGDAWEVDPIAKDGGGAAGPGAAGSPI